MSYLMLLITIYGQINLDNVGNHFMGGGEYSLDEEICKGCRKKPFLKKMSIPFSMVHSSSPPQPQERFVIKVDDLYLPPNHDGYELEAEMGQLYSSEPEVEAESGAEEESPSPDDGEEEYIVDEMILQQQQPRSPSCSPPPIGYPYPIGSSLSSSSQYHSDHDQEIREAFLKFTAHFDDANTNGCSIL